MPSYAEQNASTRGQGELVDVELPFKPFMFVGAQRGRRGGAQNQFAAGSYPIPVPMTMEYEDTSGKRRNGGHNVGCVNECQTDSVSQPH